MKKHSYYYLEAVAHALSEGQFTVKAGRQWATDLSAKTITYDAKDLDFFSQETVRGMLLHEVGHVKYTNLVEKSELCKQHPVLEEVYNTFEDMRIEDILIKEYGDFAIEGLASNAESAMPLKVTAAQSGNFIKNARLEQLMMNLLARYFTTDNPVSTFYGNTILEDGYKEMIKGSDSDVVDRLEKIHMDEVIAFMRRAKNTEEVIAYVDKVLYPLIKDYIEEAEKNMPIGIIHIRILAKNTDKQVDGEEETTSPGIPIDVEQTDKTPTDAEIEDEYSPYINTLARRLKDVLKEKASSRFTGSYKHGKLLSKNAFKVITSEQRIFSRKMNPDTPKYTVTFVLDESGSMNADRRVYAYRSAYLLEKACGRLRFKMNYIKFDENVEVIKNLRPYVTRFRGGGNDEQKVLRTVKAITNPNDDNIVFVLTDGGVGNDPKPIIQQLQKKNYIIIAVAVGLPPVSEEVRLLKKNYPVTVVTDRVDQLPRMMIDVMRSIIHR